MSSQNLISFSPVVNKSYEIAFIAEGQKDDVMSMLSSAFQDKITRNRSILHSILKTIYLCGCSVVETSVVSSAITLKQLAELHSVTITCNCLPQISISSFCMVGDRYLAFGGLF
jgi:hypothetical protein